MSRKFDTNKFINDVLNDKYALVVGNEIILNKDIEVSGDVHQFLLRKVNKIYGTKYIAYEMLPVPGQSAGGVRKSR